MSTTHPLPAGSRRLHVPAWIISAVVAGALASGATALIDGSHDTTPRGAAAAAPPPAAWIVQPGTCVDARIVGHC